MARQRRKQATARVATGVLAWEDDPGAPGSDRRPVRRPVPKLTGKLAVKIVGAAPTPSEVPPGSKAFRYWTAAEALARGVAFWRTVLPPQTTWQPSNGTSLPVRLDDGRDLNAYYDRNGLHFFHAEVARTSGVTVFSSESPDVVCHEQGHAILDAIRPQLWDTSAHEVAAFHEAFGDIAALHAALELESVRDTLIAETGGKIDRSTRISRLAEQLGWAIRQIRPDIVEATCLRNAANSIFYRDPIQLPPSAPATMLSSEPHSFSRVFTGAYLRVLAGMAALHSPVKPAALLEVSRDAGRLLVEAVVASPVVTSYYSQVAAHMLDVDLSRFGGRYRTALKTAFVRQGILSLRAATAPPPPETSAQARRALLAPAPQDEALPPIALPGVDYGLSDELLVRAASQPARFSVAGAAPDYGAIDPTQHDRAAAGFVEDLVRNGRIDFGEHADATTGVLAPEVRKTHLVRSTRGGLMLERRYFDCGFS